MKKLALIITFMALILSCSSDDDSNTDNIVGQWQMIERYESDVEVEVGCSQYYYSEFKSNNQLSADYINFDNTPAECTTVTFEILLWRKSGNDYEIYVNPDEIISVAYFDGDNLVIESNMLNRRSVYQKLQ